MVNIAPASIGKRIDWKRILERCTPDGRKKITDLHAKNEELLRRTLEEQSSIPKWEFEVYRNKLRGSEYEQLVNESQTKAQWEPRNKGPEISARLAELESEKKNKMMEASGFLDQLETQIVSLKDQMTRLQKARPVEEMTVQDVYDTFPGLKDKVHESIRNDNWSVLEDENQLDQEHGKTKVEKKHH